MVRKVINIFLIFMVMQSIAVSQDTLRTRYSVFGKAGLNFHTADFKALPGVPNCCPNYKTGYGLGYGFGLGYELPISDNMFFGAKLIMDNKGAELIERETTLVVVNLEEKNGVIEHIINSQIYLAGLNPYLSYNIDRLVNINIGSSIAYILSASYEQKEVLVEPTTTGYFKENQSRTRNLSSGTISNLNNLNFDINAGVSVDLKLNQNKTLLISPFIDFSYSFSNFVKDLQWKSYSITAGIALKYTPFDKIKVRREIFKTDTVKYIDEKIEEEMFALGQIEIKSEKFDLGDTILYVDYTLRTDTIFKPKVKPIVKEEKLVEIAEVKQVDDKNLFKITESMNSNSEIKSILIKAKKIKEFQPILNYIFFEHNSSDINKKYSKSEINKLSISSKTYFYRQVMDLVANISLKTDDKIILIGTVDPVTEKNNCELALDRAKSVKEYLIRNYGIKAEKIIIKQNTKNCAPEVATKSNNQDGYSENRRVEIALEKNKEFSLSTEREYLNPISIYPNEVSFTLNEPGKEEIKKASIILKQGDKEIVVINGRDIELGVKYKFTKNDINNISENQELSANLNLVYGSGNEETDSRNLEINKQIEDEIQRLTLKPFRVSQANLDESMKADITKFISGIDENSLLFIKGYSDLLGLKAENKGLSQTRADAVSNFIKGINPKIRIGLSKGMAADEKPIGIDSYDSPEERFMSRTVTIQAVKIKAENE